MRNNVRLRPVLTRSVFDDSRVREEKPARGNSSNTSGHCLRCLPANKRWNSKSIEPTSGSTGSSYQLREIDFYYCAVSDEGGTSAPVRVPSLIAVPSYDWCVSQPHPCLLLLMS